MLRVGDWPSLFKQNAESWREARGEQWKWLKAEKSCLCDEPAEVRAVWPRRVKFGRLLDINKDSHGGGDMLRGSVFPRSKGADWTEGYSRWISLSVWLRVLFGSRLCGVLSLIVLCYWGLRPWEKFVLESQGGRRDHWWATSPWMWGGVLLPVLPWLHQILSFY